MPGHKEDSLDSGRYSAPLGPNKISDLLVYLHAESGELPGRSNKFSIPSRGDSALRKLLSAQVGVENCLIIVKSTTDAESVADDTSAAFAFLSFLGVFLYLTTRMIQ